MSKRTKPRVPATAELVRRPGCDNWYLQWYEPAQKRGRRWSTGTADRAEAEAAWAGVCVDGSEATDTQARAEGPIGDVSVGAVLDDYWEHHARMIASSEQAAIAIRHLKRLMDGALVADLDDPEVQQDYVDARHLEAIKSGTIARELSVLRAAVRAFAEKRKVTPPRIYSVDAGEPRDRWLTPAEVERLLQAAKSPHTCLFILLMLATAARPEAILDLTWEQIDFRTGRVHLNPTGRVQSSKRRPIVRVDQRTLDLLASVERERLDHHVVTYAGFAVGSIKKSFRAAVEGAGLNPRQVTPYVLRHTAATWMAQAGVPLFDIASYLGHKDTRMVERFYVHHHPDYMDKPRAALSQRLAGIHLDPRKLNTPALKAGKTRASRQTSRQTAKNGSDYEPGSSSKSLKRMVGATGIEPVTPTMST